MAKAGEFTLRAFTNGKLDLSQAEAVADLIHSESEAAHKTAMQQMRGGFSKEIEQLRDELIHFASMIELELDFGEEDVEFADRGALEALVAKIKKVIKRLIDSFAVGNVIKNGIPVAIVGEPNVGKSTLLNLLLNEERAIVSDIAGTTRDTIEDELNIGGQIFRFIDTAGIRETTDTVESLGIAKTFEKIDQASIVIYLFDASKPHKKEIEEIEKISKRVGDTNLIILANKIDIADKTVIEKEFATHENLFMISAKHNQGVDKLTDKLLSFANTGKVSDNQNIVTNSRHYEALLLAFAELTKVEEGLAINLSGDFLAIDIRQALYHLGEITGQVSTDDLLGHIFSSFCIGK
jgi:tRNA modification GTPase